MYCGVGVGISVGLFGGLGIGIGLATVVGSWKWSLVFGVIAGITFGGMIVVGFLLYGTIIYSNPDTEQLPLLGCAK